MVTSGKFVTMSKKALDRSVPAGEFKAKCLALLDEVEATGRELIVTKRGRPVARLLPMPNSLQGSILYEAEDIIAPVDVKWDAMS